MAPYGTWENGTYGIEQGAVAAQPACQPAATQRALHVARLLDESAGTLAVTTRELGAGLPDDWEELFAEVHRSNMSKLGPDGKPILREDGKILKPEDFSPPDLEPIVRKS